MAEHLLGDDELLQGLHLDIDADDADQAARPVRDRLDDAQDGGPRRGVHVGRGEGGRTALSLQPRLVPGAGSGVVALRVPPVVRVDLSVGTHPKVEADEAERLHGTGQGGHQRLEVLPLDVGGFQEGVADLRGGHPRHVGVLVQVLTDDACAPRHDLVPRPFLQIADDGGGTEMRHQRHRHNNEEHHRHHELQFAANRHVFPSRRKFLHKIYGGIICT